MRKSTRLGAVITTLALVATATGGLAATASASSGRSTDTQAVSPKTLSIGMSSPAQPWDLAGAALGGQMDYFQAVFDPLMKLTPAGGLVPWLATSWKYNDSQTVLTLKLRSGVKFTDGTVFNASVVKANLLHTETGTNEAAGQFEGYQDGCGNRPLHRRRQAKRS